MGVVTDMSKIKLWGMGHGERGGWSGGVVADVAGHARLFMAIITFFTEFVARRSGGPTYSAAVWAQGWRFCWPHQSRLKMCASAAHIQHSQI